MTGYISKNNLRSLSTLFGQFFERAAENREKQKEKKREKADSGKSQTVQ